MAPRKLLALALAALLSAEPSLTVVYAETGDVAPIVSDSGSALPETLPGLGMEESVVAAPAAETGAVSDTGSVVDSGASVPVPELESASGAEAPVVDSGAVVSDSGPTATGESLPEAASDVVLPEAPVEAAPMALAAEASAAVGPEWVPTVESTVSGGNWSDVTSWVGGRVPSQSDEVRINPGATIYVDGDRSVARIFVSSGSSLRNANCYWCGARVLTVSGPFNNSGSVRHYSDDGNGYYSTLAVRALGDVRSSGTWKAPLMLASSDPRALSGFFDADAQFLSGASVSGDFRFSGTATNSSTGTVALSPGSVAAFGRVAGNPWLMDAPSAEVRLSGNLATSLSGSLGRLVLEPGSHYVESDLAVSAGVQANQSGTSLRNAN